MRGEHGPGAGAGSRPVGSSPHTRGTPETVAPLPRAHRFIPAYAGNADCPEATGGYVAVHPRIREERWVIRRSVISHPGSSLHTRETPPCQRDQGCFCRFIPACAGNARARFTKARSWPVHPRIRGERAVGARVVEPVAGCEKIAYYADHTVHPRIRGERDRCSDSWLRPLGSSPHTRGTPV